MAPFSVRSKFFTILNFNTFHSSKYLAPSLPWEKDSILTQFYCHVIQICTELANESEEYNNIWMVLASYWSVAAPVMTAEQHGMQTKQLSHACEYETSMMLFLHGEIMRMDRVTASPPLVDSPFFHSEHQGRVNVAKRMSTWTPTGAMGGPQHATPEKGESLLNAITDEVTSFLVDFATW